MHSFCVQFASTERVFLSEIKIVTPKQELNLPRKSTMCMQNVYNYTVALLLLLLLFFFFFFSSSFVVVVKMQAKRAHLLLKENRMENQSTFYMRSRRNQNKNLTSDDLVLGLPVSLDWRCLNI